MSRVYHRDNEELRMAERKDIYRFECDGNIQLLERVMEEDYNTCKGCYFLDYDSGDCTADQQSYDCWPDLIFRPYVEPVELKRASDYQVEEDGVSLEAIEEPVEDALDIQVGGSHYKGYEIQPIEFLQRNKVPPCEANAIKYLCRHRNKGGAEDLHKAIHYIQLLLEMEYDEDYGV